MKFSVITNPPNNNFDFFITNAGGSFLQSSSWGQWQESAGDHLLRKAYRYFVQVEDIPIAAVQLITTKLPGKDQYFLYAPYGPVWNTIADKQLEEAITVLVHQIHKEHPTALFLRFEPHHPLVQKITGYTVIPTIHIQPGKTLITDLTQTPEQLLGLMHPKTRYNIKVAQRSNVQVSQVQTNPTDALTLITETAQRQNFYTHPLSYYKDLVTFFSEKANKNLKIHIYAAHFEENLLSSGIMIDFANTRTYLFGGSSPLHRNRMAPYLLHWQAIMDAKAQGLSCYDWYGAESSTGETPGFTKFKLSFGGSIKEYGATLDIIFKPIPYKLYTVARAANRWIKHLKRI